ncbi:Tetratricopeptide TPR_1 repeat-containing protein [Stanieria cyanosphaera PCC 7437]|uniref:Tetratricopeptide TPR_1 repeat-containing protein n=1 Tax=Stanieria cyanosphaera (strain ATCC 29371 / PCC 7437) TaxID=111780 RepID=K9XNN1_STAC7|nr:tetratricopeptide repeat protein [Stanieria cyanosphaera]AFZ34220.1 Tetratricopeptide TPR_1 repeat-containing protein [Stanieria cyanosphaera PCC 7437]
MAYFCRLFWLLVLFIIFFGQQPTFAASDDVVRYHASDFFNYGLENVRQQNYQEALSNFTKVINLNSYLVHAAYSNRCLVNLQLNNYDAAKSDCAIALQRNPDNLEALLNLGLIYVQLKDYSAAIAQYQQIINRNDHDYRAYYNRGLAYFAMQDYQQAVADYSQALTSPNLTTNADRILITSDRGLAYLMLADYDKARADFNQTINLDPLNEWAYFNRACCHHRQGNYWAAIKDFTQVLQFNPAQTQVYVNRSWLYHLLGLEQAAFKDLNTALQQYQAQEDFQAYQRTITLKEKLKQIISQSTLSQWG